MTVSVRFAPSPTGWLHVGNIRAALLNWLFARRHGGTFLLRLDDTDRERSRPEYAAGIEEDLAWLGLRWDRLARQSDRSGRYEEAKARLIASGRLYPCYELPEELELKRKTRAARGLPPIYDRAALALTAEDRARLEAEGRRPHWRFKLDHREIAWDDLIRGRVAITGDSVSDPVLVREDGVFLYTFGSVVDDVDFGITHVIRGEDHVTNTAVQIQLFEALDAAPPAFAHFTLFTDASGQGFSKREGSLSVRSLREEGIEAMAIDAYLAKLGSADPVEPRTTLDELVREFDLSRFHRGGSPKFDIEELRRLNARLLHLLPFEAVRDRVPEGTDAAFWDAVRPNLTRLADVAEWRRIAHGPVAPVVEDGNFLARAADLLPAEPWDGSTFKTWADSVKEATGRKGKALFMPLRLALTGMEHGPELAALLPLVGRERALRRLAGETA